jgi:hypothetical protein
MNAFEHLIYLTYSSIDLKYMLFHAPFEINTAISGIAVSVRPNITGVILKSYLTKPNLSGPS